jgi:uncharacterized protein YdeI (YjbR/CyaY-like superfamily)
MELMSPAAKKSFTARLEKLPSALGWVIARVPFDVNKAWPERVRLRVRGEIEGFEFRTSLFAFSEGAGHFLLVNKAMQGGAGVRLGDTARFTLQPDLEERSAEPPSELAKVLRGDRKLERWFGQLSPSMRRELGKWADQPKSAEGRKKRAEKVAERLYLAMDGETEPPPVLRVLFQRQPLARVGWEAMTPSQRRHHLLGIFYYETADARERRAAKAVEVALKTASRANKRIQ